MVDRWDVDDYVDTIATMPIRRFYPTAVAKSTGLPLHDVFERLLLLAKDEKLLLHWEIRCPGYECTRNMEIVDDPNIAGQTVVCGICGDEVDISPDIMFPVFEVNPKYKERMSKKKPINL